MRKPLREIEHLESRTLLAANFAAADFDADRRVDQGDIDLLWKQIRTGAHAPAFDLNQDGQTSAADVDYLLSSLLQVPRGDLDLDRDVDFTDFLKLAVNFGKAGGWAEGDLNGDARVGFDDFLLLAESYGHQQPSLAWSHVQANGNRYAEGFGMLTAATHQDVPLPFRPEWVVGAPLAGQQLWVAVSAEGDVAAVLHSGDKVEPFQMTPERLPPGMPPHLEVVGETARLLVHTKTPSRTHPIRVSRHDDRLAYVDPLGVLHVEREAGIESLDLDALVDGRILRDDLGRLLVLAGPSDVYGHGIFGDRVEPTRFHIVDTKQTPAHVTTVTVAEGRVIEGLFALWEDLDGDGAREVLVTLSDVRNGGQVTVYNEDGSVELQGPGVGRGFRWRHQIAVGPVGPSAEWEFVDVLTPHIGGVAEFRAVAAGLPIQATHRGVTSHVNRSRNIDLAMIANVDQDPQAELIVPSFGRDALRILSRTEAGTRLDATLPLGGQLATNLAVQRSVTGRLRFAVGRQDQVLRIWQ